MDHPAPIASLTVPLGGQRIEMHPMDFVSGGLPMLRVRIREGKRFTVFDVDPGTALAWGEALANWGRAQGGGSP
jgi:hypothetical protein